MTPEALTLDVFIRRPAERVYDFVARPENLALWASGLGRVERDGAAWIAHGEAGRARLRFVPRNTLGVVDHWVEMAPGVEIHIPMRVLPQGEGCRLSLTLFRGPDWDDARFAADADWVRRDLDTLRILLESAAEA